MLIIALVLALIGLTALVTAIVTSNELIAWVCIGASVIGVLLLIVDALRERSRGGAATSEAEADAATVGAEDYPEDETEAEPETVVAEAVSEDETKADEAESEVAEGDEPVAEEAVDEAPEEAAEPEAAEEAEEAGESAASDADDAEVAEGTTDAKADEAKKA